MTLILICCSHSVMMCSVAASASHRAARSKGDVNIVGGLTQHSHLRCSSSNEIGNYCITQGPCDRLGAGLKTRRVVLGTASAVSLKQRCSSPRCWVQHHSETESGAVVFVGAVKVQI